jgi:redox-sensitive bicupin YhaK (pirin superfamily)
MTQKSNIDIRRADERFHSRTAWLDSYHSFSFGLHYDPKNTHHGLLLVSNDDIIKPGTGFSTHPHQDMEIVTWVLDGELEHKDSQGHKGIIYPGLAQRMSAGTGIWHSEMNPRGDKAVHLVQMWVLPDTERIHPGYEQLDISHELEKGGLVPIASGRGHNAAISIRQKGAVLWGGRLKPGEKVTIPESRFAHVYIAKGAARLEGAGELDAGNAVRLIEAGTPRLTAHAQSGAEVLIWETAENIPGV